MTRSRFLIRGLAAGAALAAIGLVAPATAGAGPVDRTTTATSAGATERDRVLHAMQRELGLTRDRAEKELASQDAARELDTRLKAQLGADFAGDWYDRDSGRLVVAVSSPKRLAEVRAAGAEAKLVAHSRAKLDAVKADVDRLAADRSTASGITSWYTDATTNAVVVTVPTGQQTAQQTSRAVAKLAKHGTAVRIERSDLAPSTTADYLDGGDPISGCSVGFNAFAGSTRYVLFAGHCGPVGAHQYGTGGNWIGPIVGSNFPGDDFGLVRVDNTGYWMQGPWVDAYNGGFYNLSAWYWSAPPAGLFVCKSGKTTGFTCGTVLVTSESVNLNHQGTIVTVHGLTRHNACVEPGDSGGSNISWDSAGLAYAEGVTSGASLLAGGLCRSKGGLDNISWFQPVGEAISAYGISLYTL